jgi:hypothetical protein
MSTKYLNDFRTNITSEYGEDGVLAEIFNRIGTKNKWFCDLGAWDGIHASNTYNLTHSGWQGVLIESDQERCAKITTGIPICAVVEPNGPNTLDSILSKTPIPKDFDLLSIDTDDKDALIWASLEHYSPQVVVIEVNSSFAPGQVQTMGSDVYDRPYSVLDRKWTQTITSAVELGKHKGYELALHTGNAIFVRREHLAALGIDPDNWRELFNPGWLT